MRLSSRCLFWLTNALALMAVAVAMLHPNPAVAAEGTSAAQEATAQAEHLAQI